MNSTDPPTSTPLLGLLEPSSAKAWRDEFLDLKMDMRPLSFMFAASDLRLQIVIVPPPSLQQMPAIVSSVDQMLRAEIGRMNLAFALRPRTLIRRMAAMPPREVRKKLRQAYARCARRIPKWSVGRKLEPDDFR